MKNRTLLLSYFFCFFILFSFSQKRKKVNIDSTFIEIKKSDRSKEKVDLLIGLYRTSVKQRQTNDKIINEALILSEELFYINGIAKCYNRKGLTARYQSKYNESVRLHKRALSYFKKTTDTLSRLKCLNNIGVSYRKMNQENLAFKYYFEALKVAEQIKSNKSIAIANNGIGNIYVDIGAYDKALEYLKKAIEIKVEYNNDRNQEIGLSNIGEVFMLKKQYDSAFYYINKATVISKRTNNIEGVAIKQNLFGILHQKKGQFKKSVSFYDKAIPNLIMYNNKRYLCNSYINKGISLVELNEYDTALQNINNGLQLAKKINSTENIALAYKGLVDYYSKKGDYKKALIAHKTSTVFYDSILNIESRKSILSTQLTFESVKKDKLIQKLAEEKELNAKKSKNRFNKLLIGFLISILGILGMIYLYFLKKKFIILELDSKNNEIRNYLLEINELKKESENNKISNQISSHFDKYKLSKREQEVFNYISIGLSNSEIAEKLFLSKNTIKTHIKNIYYKLDVKNRKQAIHKIEVS